jgi:hypothetical protein
MSKEQSSHHEARSILMPALKKGLERFENTTLFYMSHDSTGTNFDYCQDFRLLTWVAGSAHTLHVNPNEWRERVERERKLLKSDMIELGDWTTAIDIDQEYCEYLWAIGEHEYATTTAQHITQEYEATSNEAFADAEMNEYLSSFLLKIRKYLPLQVVCYNYLKEDNLAKAQELMEGIDLGSSGYLYFSGVLDYYERKKDFFGINAFIDEMNDRVAGLHDDGGYNVLIKKAKEARNMLILEQEGKKYKDEDAKENQTPYEWIQKQTDRMVFLLEAGKHEEAKSIAEAVLAYVNEETNPSKDEDLREKVKRLRKEISKRRRQEEEIGSLAFANKKQAKIEDENDYLFKNGDRVRILCLLATIFTQYPACEDLLDRCIYGDTEMQSIVESIQMSAKRYQPSAWISLMNVFGKTQKWEELAEIYNKACNISPDSMSTITLDYARHLLDTDEEKACKLVEGIPDLTVRVDGFVDIIRWQVEKKGFVGWQKKIAQLIALEDVILKPKTDFSIYDLDMFQDTEDEQYEVVEKKKISTGRFILYDDSEEIESRRFRKKSPFLLANLARSAILKGEWEIFSTIFEDERLIPSQKVKVLKEVTDWLTKGKEIVHSF